MWHFLSTRLVMGFLTIWVTTIMVTLLIHAVPGDPVQIMYAQSQGTTPEQIEQVRRSLGLDRPIHIQYLMYMERLFQGDLGVTIRGGQPVLEVIFQRLPNTLMLAVTAMFIAILIGVPIGFLAAYREGTVIDIALMVLAIAGISMPHFWLGLMLLFFFALELGWLPVSGNSIMNLILPALTLGLSNAAIFARLTRSSMIDVMSQDFIQTAYAKGLPKALVLRRHVMRAGLLPVVTMMGLQFAFMMGGAIVVENIFSWNGVGRMAVEAIFQRDYPIIQGFILTFSVVVVVVAIAIDALYAVLDPRIRRA
ncbi:ABC transporter permease [Paracoccaceae bacterium]|jgi:ABC-type dipeptide/oligopeptide/nickel transport system permease component|nr:ABC transporter permease [Paracoccaceae bacterium]MDA8688725.1 ABC transporter permease [Paracoccaceae bacterium]MDC0499462.1 ABC transporter permease [Paracoccaceae bacterium]MDC0583804.1 ABC transporter permease [Paracoccaceae bacterium]MDC0869209.1 ABC transporter permease [Paracoccaceae bacterium]